MGNNISNGDVANAYTVTHIARRAMATNMHMHNGCNNGSNTHVGNASNVVGASNVAPDLMEDEEFTNAVSNFSEVADFKKRLLKLEKKLKKCDSVATVKEVTL